MTSQSILPLRTNIGVRAQVLEVIVRQSLSGAPWREICKGAMEANSISIIEVERHVEYRRQRLAETYTGTGAKEQERLEQYVQEWHNIARSTQSLDRDRIKAAIARLCSLFSTVTPPTIIFCQSPLQLKLYPELLQTCQWSRNELESAAQNSPTVKYSLAAVDACVQERFWQNLFSQAIDPPPANEKKQINAPSFSPELDAVWEYLHEKLTDDWFAITVALPQRLVEVLEPIRQLINLFVRTAGTVLDGSTTEAGAHLLREAAPQARRSSNPVAPRVDQRARLNFLPLEGRFLARAPEPWTQIQANAVLCCKFAGQFHGPDFYQDCLDRRKLEIMEARYELARCVPACVYQEGIFYICARPKSFSFNQFNQVHGSSGPAVQFDDGLDIFAFNGTVVPANIILNPDEITVKRIEGMINIEVRRVMIEMYGVQRYVFDSGALLIHEDECGRLYRKDMPDDEALVMVQVLNATPEPDGTIKQYFLRVPPNIETARAAVAWTFNFKSTDYKPTSET